MHTPADSEGHLHINRNRLPPGSDEEDGESTEDDESDNEDQKVEEEDSEEVVDGRGES